MIWPNYQPRKRVGEKDDRDGSEYPSKIGEVGVGQKGQLLYFKKKEPQLQMRGGEIGRGNNPPS